MKHRASYDTSAYEQLCHMSTYKALAHTYKGLAHTYKGQLLLVGSCCTCLVPYGTNPHALNTINYPYATVTLTSLCLAPMPPMALCLAPLPAPRCTLSPSVHLMHPSTLYITCFGGQGPGHGPRRRGRGD